MKYRQGFTLIEVMVSAAVLGVIMFYLTDMLVQQSRTYAVVDDVHEAQQNLRAVADLLEREIRSTGMLVREGGAVCGIDNGVGGSDLLFVTDADVMDPTDVTEAGLGLDIAGGFTGGGTSTRRLLARVNPSTRCSTCLGESLPLPGSRGTASRNFSTPYRARRSAWTKIW